MSIRWSIASSEIWIFGYILLTLLLECAMAASAPGCSKLRLEGSVYQTSREGLYYRTNGLCTQRYVYKHEAGQNYIFYISTPEGWRGWMVGSTACENKAGIAVESVSMTPEGVNAIWEEVDGGTWTYNSRLNVGCQKLSAGSVIGIVAGLLILGCLIAFFVVRCKGQARKRRPQQHGDPRQNVNVHVISNNRVGLGSTRQQVRPQQPPYGIPQPPPYHSVRAPGRAPGSAPPRYPGPAAPGYPGYQFGPRAGSMGPPPPYACYTGPRSAHTNTHGIGAPVVVGLSPPPPYIIGDPAYPPVQPSRSNFQQNSDRNEGGNPPKVSD